MDLQLTSKSAVVTGASIGTGRAVAMALAREGVRVAAVARRAPEDLAVLVVFLASPIARYITGAVIPVDGGLRRYQF